MKFLDHLIFIIIGVDTVNIEKLIEYLIIEEHEAQDNKEYDCDKCHMCEPGDRYCIRD